MVGTDPGEEVLSRVKMPVRYWRWMWLSELIRLASWLVVGVLSVVYFPAVWLVWAVNHASGGVYRFRMNLLQRDMRRSGWVPPDMVKAPAIRLSPEWREKLGR